MNSSDRRKTYFIDIDGVIFKHCDAPASVQWFTEPTVLPGVRDFFDKVEKEGAAIVLVTARRESCRKALESNLRRCGIYWDHLIMGVGNGQRILINDHKPSEAPDTAVGWNIVRNTGL